MSWRLTVRLFSGQPNGRRDPLTHNHVLDDLADVPLLIELAKRQGEVVYCFLEPQPGWLSAVKETLSARRRRRHSARRDAA